MVVKLVENQYVACYREGLRLIFRPRFFLLYAMNWEELSFKSLGP